MNSFARSLNRLHSGPLARASPLSRNCRATSTAVLASGDPKLGAAAIATKPNKDRSSYLSKNSEPWVLARTSTAAAQCGKKHRPWSSSTPSARKGPQFAAQALTRGRAASRTSFWARCPPTNARAKRAENILHAQGDCGCVSDKNATCLRRGSSIKRSATALHNLANGAPGATVLIFAASPLRNNRAKASPAKTWA